jgi:hypothetical protein
VVVEAFAPRTCFRSPHACPIVSMLSATATARSANTSPGAYTCEPPAVSANAAVTFVDTRSGRRAHELWPSPACDTTPRPSADTFTRDATAIIFTCEVPFRKDH